MEWLDAKLVIEGLVGLVAILLGTLWGILSRRVTKLEDEAPQRELRMTARLDAHAQESRQQLADLRGEFSSTVHDIYETIKTEASTRETQRKEIGGKLDQITEHLLNNNRTDQ